LQRTHPPSPLPGFCPGLKRPCLEPPGRVLCYAPLLWRAGAAVRAHDVTGYRRSLWLPIKSPADDPAGRHFGPERFS
jgi:hypothetical protein